MTWHCVLSQAFINLRRSKALGSLKVVYSARCGSHCENRNLTKTYNFFFKSLEESSTSLHRRRDIHKNSGENKHMKIALSVAELRYCKYGWIIACLTRPRGGGGGAVNPASEVIDTASSGAVTMLQRWVNASLKQNKYLECQQIPKLKQEIESWSSQSNQLLSEVKRYKLNIKQTDIKELQTSFRNLEKDSKVQVDKILAEKKHVMSQLAAYKSKVEKYQ
ncbi:hypothetical protein CCH79_00019339 [Gambusia affinis]|uniref:Uncharacterized protein n=1 Tax=Gambusia affinis TaxID=33528 RepID=A0A315UW55_GAMAF|nr:hypothetical protein CCH79_00019339 [Gambusia affinis]